MKNICKKWDKNGNIVGLELLIVIGAILLPLVSFLYMDTNSIIRCGIDVFKSILLGEGGDFYKFAGESRDAGLMVHPPTYDFFFYLTVGIWELPLAMIEAITGKSMYRSSYAMIYSKLLLLVFICLSAWMIYKIARALMICEKNAKWASFMFLTSGMIVSYVCIAGQYDIMGLFFTLVGVYFYIKGDMKLFGVMFAIAVQYKFFPLFVFLPLLLLKEKKVWKVMCYIIPCVVAVLLIKIPFLNDGAIMLEKAAISDGMFHKILGTTFWVEDNIQVPISAITVGAVCLYCYFKEISDKEMEYYAIYIPFLSLGVLFLSFCFYPYWLLYIAPWIPLLFFMRDDMHEKFFWVELGMVSMILLYQYSQYEWIYSWNNMENMLLDQLVLSIYEFEKPIGLYQYKNMIMGNDNVLYAFFMLFLGTMILILRPKKDVKMRSEEFDSRTFLWIRFIAQYAVSALPLGIYVFNVIKTFVIR